MQRTSQQYIEGLTVAQTEYDRELKARRDAEAEVTRLRILLSGQAARLSAMSGVTKKQELQQQLSQQMATSLDGLGREMSKLKVERDMTLAEVEELAKSKKCVFVLLFAPLTLVTDPTILTAPSRRLPHAPSPFALTILRRNTRATSFPLLKTRRLFSGRLPS